MKVVKATYTTLPRSGGQAPWIPCQWHVLDSKRSIVGVFVTEGYARLFAAAVEIEGESD